MMERFSFAPHPVVSVVIPHFYASRREKVTALVEVLKSQTFSALEVIVVKGVSPQGKAINDGARQAKGKYLIVMDDDTELDQKELVANLVRALEDHPDVAMAGASIVSPPNLNDFQRNAAKQFPRFHMPVVDRITDSDMACHGCVIFRRDIFEQIGMEREDIIRGLDPDLRVRIRKAGYRVVLVPGAWVYHPFPPDFLRFMKLFYRNGYGSAYLQVYYPEINFDTDEKLDSSGFVPQRPFIYRLFRFPLRLLQSAARLQWIRFLGYAAYAFGYAAGYARYNLTKLSPRSLSH